MLPLITHRAHFANVLVCRNLVRKRFINEQLEKFGNSVQCWGISVSLNKTQYFLTFHGLNKVAGICKCYTCFAGQTFCFLGSLCKQKLINCFAELSLGEKKKKRILENSKLQLLFFFFYKLCNYLLSLMAVTYFSLDPFNDNSAPFLPDILVWFKINILILAFIFSSVLF